MTEATASYRVVERAASNGHGTVTTCDGPDELGNCPAVRKGDEVPCAGLKLKPVAPSDVKTWEILVPQQSAACPVPAIKRRKWSFRSLGVITLVAGFLAGAGTATGWTLALAHGSTAAPVAVSKPVHLSLVIATPDMLGSDVGPAYLPSDFTVPANTTVTITVTNFDDATALPAQYATATGIIGKLTIQPLDPADPNATAASTTAASLDPDTGVSHTFTIPTIGLNVPIAPKAKTTFTIHTGKAGKYTWHCMDPCGTGASGWGGAMDAKGYMTGTMTVA